jgi:Uma2 family endonuclease
MPTPMEAETRAARALPRRLRFSVARYERMIETGIIPEGLRVELLEGEIVEKMPIGDRHAACVLRFNHVFSRRLGDRAHVSIQNPARLGGSVPEPDAQLLAPRADFYAGGKPEAADILLLVEVADSSRELDTGRKAKLYARAGIAEYWIVDLVQDVVRVHRGARPDGTWDNVQALLPAAMLAPHAFPDLEQRVADLLLLSPTG